MRKPIVIAALLAVSIAGGCGPFKYHRLPQRVIAPTTVVTQVGVVESSNEATRYNIVVQLDNPNSFPLPLEIGRFTVTIDGQTYKADRIPNRTVPAKGQISCIFPAVISAPQSTGDNYVTMGKIVYSGPGQLRKLLYDLGMPKPKVQFAGQGVTMDAPPPPAPKPKSTQN